MNNLLKKISTSPRLLPINNLKYSTGSSPSESILNGFMGSVGNTALIKLEKLSKEVGSNILVKCEYMNPGGKLSLIPNSKFIFLFLLMYLYSEKGQ